MRGIGDARMELQAISAAAIHGNFIYKKVLTKKTKITNFFARGIIYLEDC
jgi:hypothetical protein